MLLLVEVSDGSERIMRLSSETSLTAARVLSADWRRRVVAGEDRDQDMRELIRTLGRAGKADRRGQRGDRSGQNGSGAGGGAYNGPMTREQVAEVLGVSERTVSRRFHAGELKGRREGRRLLFDREDVSAYLEECAT